MPVHFACPQCRQMLKISRRKIGTICECPRCGNPTAVPAPATTQRELAHSSSNRLNAAIAPPVSLFDEVNELLAQGTFIPAAIGSDSSVEMPKAVRTPPVDRRWSQPPDDASDASANKPQSTVARTRLLVQCALFSLVAAVAFAVGFLLGQGRAVPPSGSNLAPAAQPAQHAAEASSAAAQWPTPVK